MAEKKKTEKKEIKKSTVKNNNKSQKAQNKSNGAKTKKASKAQSVLKGREKEVEKIDTYKVKREKKNSNFKTWFNNLTLEQVVIGGVIIIAILLLILIGVSTKNTKTKEGNDIVIKVDGKTITADDLYNALKKQSGQSVAINLIDDYILNKEYKTTDEMKESANKTIENYKTTYGDSYTQFLQYNGLNNSKELKNLLIKNSKLTLVTEAYIKDKLTEKEMKDYYENNIHGDISAKHILISFDYDDNATDKEKEEKEKKAKEKALKIIEKLKKGEDFSELAKKYSTDTGSKENGGDLGYFNTGDMVEEFEKAAYKLNINEYTLEPVKTTYGYHIIMKTGEKKKPSYKKSKETIIEKLIDEKKNNDSTISAKAMANLREKYNIKIKDKTIKNEYDNYLKESTTTTTTSSNNK